MWFAFRDTDLRTRMQFSSLVSLVSTVVILTSCTTVTKPVSAPVNVSAAEACGIDSSVWKQIPIPAQRDALLELKSDQAKEPVRKDFLLAGTPEETWFESADGNLLGCRFKQQESCGGGLISTVVFSRYGTPWKAEPVLHTICHD